MMDIITYSKINKVSKKVDSAITEEEIHEKSQNLFNKDSATDGYYFKMYTPGIGTPVEYAYSCIEYVGIDGAGDYSWYNPKSIYGADLSKYVILFDSNKEYIKRIEGSIDLENDLITHFTVTQSDIANGAVFFGYSVMTNKKDEAMIVKSSVYPAEYIPYYERDYTVIGFAGHITEENADFIDNVPPSENLFDKNNVVDDAYIDLNNGDIISYARIGYEFIKINGAGTYAFLNASEFFGPVYAKRAVLFDANKEFIKYITGDFDADNEGATLVTVSSSDIESGAVYFGYSVKSVKKELAMFVKSDKYPTDYIPYHGAGYGLSEEVKVLSVATQSNPLYKKQVVFDGDSICYGRGNGGWAKIIGKNNKMDWHNVGVSGATITGGTTSGGENRHWVSRYIDTIHDNYPVLDYLILEGGTNDADLLTDNEIGTFDPAKYSSFDDETFVGALDSLFSKAITYYPKAKIGFIIAQKMGLSSTYGYEADDSPSTRRRRKFFEIVIQACKKWGIRYIDLWEGSPLCPKLSVYYDSSKTTEENEAEGKAYLDGQHLTQVGYKIITPIIERWMQTL